MVTDIGLLARAKVRFGQRLGPDWRDLAAVLGIPPHLVSRFPQGTEAYAIWDYLELRDELQALPSGLRHVGRRDLADLVEEPLHTEPGSSTGPDGTSSTGPDGTSSAGPDGTRHVLFDPRNAAADQISGPPDPAAGSTPRAFICYAHDSDDHKLLVRAFAEFLISNGIDAHIDSWYQQKRRDWQLWATGQIRAADFVLVIASPKCRLVGDGENAPGEHRGLGSEMNLLRELYHAEPAVWRQRILPVVLSGRSIDEIPTFLQPHTADHYIVDDLTVSRADGLLRHLTRQAPYVAPPPGSIPRLLSRPAAYNPGQSQANVPLVPPPGPRRTMAEAAISFNADDRPAAVDDLLASVTHELPDPDASTT